MSEFTLYAYTFVSRAERIQWTLEELNFAYEIQKLNPFKGDTSTESFASLSPLKKVPVLVHHLPHRDLALTESLAIMEYLDDYAGRPLSPRDIEETYQYRRAMYFGISELEAYLWVANQSTLLKGIYNWPEKSEVEALKQVEKALPEVFSWLEKHAFIAGNSFTLADIFYTQLLHWARRYQCNLPNHVEAYLERMAARPAMPKGFL